MECTSVKVISQIEKLEKVPTPFPVDELPDHVAALPPREGLLQEYDAHPGRWSRVRVKVSNSTNSMKAQLLSRFVSGAASIFRIFRHAVARPLDNARNARLHCGIAAPGRPRLDHTDRLAVLFTIKLCAHIPAACLLGWLYRVSP